MAGRKCVDTNVPETVGSGLLTTLPYGGSTQLTMEHMAATHATHLEQRREAVSRCCVGVRPCGYEPDD